MNKSFVAGLAVLGLYITPTLAADLTTKAPIYTPAAAPSPAFSWTGFYLGINGGAAVNAGGSNVTAVNNDDGLVNTNQENLKSAGGFGGGQIGYNWLLAPQWVAGIEADIQGAGINGSAAVGAINPQLFDRPDQNAFNNASATSKLNWFGTFRGRLGYALDRTLIYATGGLAFGGVKDGLSILQFSEGVPLGGVATRNRTLTGYTVGGGFEQFMTPLVSLKGEYQYMNLGSTTLATTGVNLTNGFEGIGVSDCCDAPSGAARISHSYHTVRLGLNIKLSN